MFGFIKRALSIESMTNAVASKIERDMARDPLSPRNRAGAVMVQAIHSVRDRAIAQREFEKLAKEYNHRWPALQERAARFDAQSEEYRAQHFEKENGEIQQERAEIEAILNRVNELKDRYGVF